MAEEPDDIVLRYLRRLDEKVDRLDDRLDDLTQRAFAVEGRVAAMLQAQNAQTAGIARIDTRLDRVEQRLDLRESEAP